MIGGIKMVTRLPGRNPSLNSEIFLYNMEDAKLKAILDGNYITAFRTAAVAALAIDTFAKKDFNTIAIMGLGVTASAIMNMLSYTLKDKNINIKLLKYKDQAESFIKKYEKNEQFSFEICDTHQELIVDSDVVISTVTYTDEYLSEYKWFKKGALLLPVHVMGFGNVDYLFDKVYLDDYNHLKHLENIDRYKYSCEFYDVLSKQGKGRENDDERIISYNIGLSIHDILFANKIYELCEILNCEEIELKEPKEKYWIQFISFIFMVIYFKYEYEVIYCQKISMNRIDKFMDKYNLIKFVSIGNEYIGNLVALESNKVIPFD